MVVRRTSFFLFLFMIILVIFPLKKLVWLIRSEKTMGVFGFHGEGGALDQMRQSYSKIDFKHGKETVTFKGPGSLRLKKGDLVPVRYLPGNPTDAMVVSFIGIWGSSVVYGGIFFATLLAVFLHPDIVPRRAKLKITIKKPYIRICI